MVAADVEFSDAGDDGHKDGRKQRTDVEDEEFFAQCPSEGEEEQDDEGEEDVSTDGGALVGGVRIEVGRWSGQCWLLSECGACDC